MAILWLTRFAGVTVGQSPYEVLHTFVGNDNTAGWNGNPDGANPAAPLVQGPDGRFYGTTVNGSAAAAPDPSPAGTVFVMDASNAVTILHHFSPPNVSAPNPAYEGQSPYAGLTLAGDGYFYGTTWYPQYLHSQSGGSVFKINARGDYDIVSRFEGFNGAGPYGGVILGSDGRFYGTTTRGGHYDEFSACCIAGTIFTLASPSTSPRFAPERDFGQQLFAFPYSAYNSLKSGLIEDKREPGVFYGTTLYGPDPAGGGGFGTVFKFKVTSPGGFTMLHAFDYTHGSSPLAALIQATDGSFYGTTYFGGTFGEGICATNGCGTAFKMDPAGHVTVLHSFKYSDGANPRGSLLQASDGNFYGTTEWGGASGYGTVFKMDAAGNVTTLYSFIPGPAGEGTRPWAGVIQGIDGKLYGTTYYGGSENKGVVYRLDAGLPPATAYLTITKTSAPNPATVGQRLTYTITVTNGGPNAATDTVVRDGLDASLDFVSVTPSQGSCSYGTEITCSLGAVVSGASATVTIVVTPTQAGSVSNIATVTANEMDPFSKHTVETSTEVLMPANAAPVCTAAVASPNELAAMGTRSMSRPIAILGVTDPDGDATAIRIDSIFQDEPVSDVPRFSPDGSGVGTAMASLRQERTGTTQSPGNGRVYYIAFTARDGKGASCTGEVRVAVRFDMAKAAVPDGKLFDSTKF